MNDIDTNAFVSFFCFTLATCCTNLSYLIYFEQTTANRLLIKKTGNPLKVIINISTDPADSSVKL